MTGTVAGEPSTGKVVFFWDVDTQWGADRSRSPGGPKSWGGLDFDNLDRLLELHAAYEAPACFAVVGSAALAGEHPYHGPEKIRALARAGHEIASHSHRHEWLPGLDREALRESLGASRRALEQCIGAPVVTFVPPFNQPFDFPSGLSFSLSERREAGADRSDLKRVCEVLVETGYRVCRVSFRSLAKRLAERLTGRRADDPERVRRIAGMRCLRLNTPGGFDGAAVAMLERTAREGGLAVVYGHPHSLLSGNEQDQSHLVRLLERLAVLRASGSIRVALPRELAEA
jgi:peptidoglycan/xylan/chitin deacetylase (PgdA/CDA1 family)